MNQDQRVGVSCMYHRYCQVHDGVKDLINLGLCRQYAEGENEKHFHEKIEDESSKDGFGLLSLNSVEEED